MITGRCSKMSSVGRGPGPRRADMVPQRKHPRLDASVYRYPGPPCSITIAVVDRRTIFGLSHDAFTRSAVGAVQLLAKNDEVPVHVALFMPDHIHLCLEASIKISIIDFVSKLKSSITRLGWQQGLDKSFLQLSFYDHLLRTDEDITKVVKYILLNPVRAEIVIRWQDYPYWFSNKYRVENLMA